MVLFSPRSRSWTTRYSSRKGRSVWSWTTAGPTQIRCQDIKMLKAIKIVFMSPNTTSVTQPMNHPEYQGAVQTSGETWSVSSGPYWMLYQPWRMPGPRQSHPPLPTARNTVEIQSPRLQRMMTMTQKMTSPWLCWLPFSMEVALMLMMRSSTSVPLTDDDIVPEVQSSSRAQVEEEDIWFVDCIKLKMV